MDGSGKISGIESRANRRSKNDRGGFFTNRDRLVETTFIDWKSRILSVKETVSARSQLLFRSANLSDHRYTAGKCSAKKGLNSIVIGPDPLLFQRIRAHLKVLGWETVPCRELSSLKEKFKEYEPGLLFVDWERLNVRDTVDRLKNMPQRGIFPTVIGIRDVKRENLFQDLSVGIGDYCLELYSEKEIFQILNHSIPDLESESYGSENFKRLVFKFRTGIQPAEIRVEKIAPTRFSGSRLEKIKQGRILDWMNEFL